MPRVDWENPLDGFKCHKHGPQIPKLWRHQRICPVCRIERSQKCRQRFRAETITAYGGMCACCGETDPAFLTMDHKGGGGAEFRRTTGKNGAYIYRWLKNHGFPKDDFQLLCWNCNWAKGTGLECPHQIQINEIIGFDGLKTQPKETQIAA